MELLDQVDAHMLGGELVTLQQLSKGPVQELHAYDLF